MPCSQAWENCWLILGEGPVNLRVIFLNFPILARSLWLASAMYMEEVQYTWVGTSFLCASEQSLSTFLLFPWSLVDHCLALLWSSASWNGGIFLSVLVLPSVIDGPLHFTWWRSSVPQGDFSQTSYPASSIEYPATSTWGMPHGKKMGRWAQINIWLDHLGIWISHANPLVATKILLAVYLISPYPSLWWSNTLELLGMKAVIGHFSPRNALCLPKIWFI